MQLLQTVRAFFIACFVLISCDLATLYSAYLPNMETSVSAYY
ncbi:hypothetical protein GARC_3013 [Paraglaciecola arctica BSs20135]|uniref:Uncharacterized protein n=1 Tax=Paraglaciecola arctica BSs20135 TaxID=493475 RepID=K6Y7Q0_9ALTE|nr:hypothetical protein GARC_3013 [Paraglaciecola arctica BSs20135]